MTTLVSKQEGKWNPVLLNPTILEAVNKPHSSLPIPVWNVALTCLAEQKDRLREAGVLTVG